MRCSSELCLRLPHLVLVTTRRMEDVPIPPDIPMCTPESAKPFRTPYLYLVTVFSAAALDRPTTGSRFFSASGFSDLVRDRHLVRCTISLFHEACSRRAAGEGSTYDQSYNYWPYSHCSLSFCSFSRHDVTEIAFQAALTAQRRRRDHRQDDSGGWLASFFLPSRLPRRYNSKSSGTTNESVGRVCLAMSIGFTKCGVTIITNSVSFR